MLAFLPIAFLFINIILLRHYVLTSWRLSALFSAAITGTLLVGITEVLSLFHVLSFGFVLAAWFLFTIAAVCATLPILRVTFTNITFSWKDLYLSEKTLLVLIGIIVLVTGITASVSTPNTWDSMTYHLSRVEHWIQNKTLAYYPTHIIRQLYITPAAEFVIAHLRILGALESAANLVQWLAMVGSLLGVSFIAKQLGASRRGQIFTSVITVTIPMGILQAVSTQTDYVGAFWLLNCIVFLIELQRNFKSLYVVAAGLSLGLALLSKGNSYIFIFPFLIGYMAASFKTFYPRVLVAILGLIVCILIINAGHYQRNIQVFGSASWTNTSLTNASFDLQVLWGNVLRNLGLQMSTPFTDVNESLRLGLANAAKSLSADINDPRATIGGIKFTTSQIYFDEDYATNLVHTIAFLLVFILCWFFPSKNKGLYAYLFKVLLAGILFCWVVRWQPWNGRFHLPLFILFCPFFGAFMDHILNKKLMLCMGIIFFVCSSPWLFFNKQHPWFHEGSIWKQPKPAQYFYKNQHKALHYISILKQTYQHDCRAIGLISGEDDWQYPLWSLLKQRKGTRIEDVQVTNESAQLKYPLGQFSPCMVVNITMSQPPFLELSTGVFRKVWSLENENGFSSSIYLLAN